MRRLRPSNSLIRNKFLALSLTASIITASPALAQAPIDFSGGRKAFPNPINQYLPTNVAPPLLANSPRIDQLMQNGKIMLSLSDAIALALENNLDIAIQRYNLSIADTDILRAKAGSGIRGVATGVVQGTPGGTGTGIGAGAQGGGAGGTSTGAGGAGAGTSGLVSSTLAGAGPTVEPFDPSLNSNMQIEHLKSPQGNTIVSGVPFLINNTGTANFSYNQGFATGTAMSLGFNNSRNTSNSLRNLLNPQLNSSFRFTVSQHLLQGFGIMNQRRNIVIAKNNREITDIGFRLQVISTVNQIQNIYWDLVNAYEDVKAKERAVTLAQRLSSDNRKQVEIGTLAPIEIVRADSEVAARNQDLIISQTNLQLQQLLIKNALTRTLSDQVLASAEVIPTDTMAISRDDQSVVPIQDLLQEALQHRPELAQSRIDLTNRSISKRAARNSLLPTVDLFGFYGAAALSGDITAAGRQIPGLTGVNTGYSDAFHNLFNSTGPDKGAGLSISIPVLNRSAQADQIRSELEYRQAETRLQQQQNQISIEVRNAQFNVQQNRARVEAATKGRELALQSLDAETKKYQLGASTNFNVLQAQRDLATAESNLVTATAAYQKSRVELDRVTGNTLTRLGIEIAEAEKGQVHKLPVVPNVVPNPNPGALTLDQQAKPPQPNPQQTPK